MIFLVVATLVGIGNAGEELRTMKGQRRRLAVEKEWTECTECDGSGYIKEMTRFNMLMNRECRRCNGDGGSYEIPVPAEVQEAMQRFYRENGRKMHTRELSEACTISTQMAFNYLKAFRPQSRRRLAGKYNKDGTLNKEWQAKQDAAKAAKQARWKANSGAEARLRRQGEVTRTQQLRTQGLLSSSNHRVSRRRLKWTDCAECDGRGQTKAMSRFGFEMPTGRDCRRCNGVGGYETKKQVPAEIQAAMQKKKMQPFELAEECNISIMKATQYLNDFKLQYRSRRRLAEYRQCWQCNGHGSVFGGWTKGYLTGSLPLIAKTVKCKGCDGLGKVEVPPVPVKSARELREAAKRRVAYHAAYTAREATQKKAAEKAAREAMEAEAARKQKKADEASVRDAKVQEAMQRFYRKKGRKMHPSELSEACNIYSLQVAFNYLKGFKPINA